MTSSPFLSGVRLLPLVVLGALTQLVPLGLAQATCPAGGGATPPGGATPHGGSPVESHSSGTRLTVLDHKKTKTYYGFDEFQPTHGTGRPKKYAVLAWSGVLREYRDEVPYIGSVRTEYSGTFTYSGPQTTNSLQTIAYIDRGSQDGGTGAHEWVTVNEGGPSCHELHDSIDVKRTLTGSPGVFNHGLREFIPDGQPVLTAVSRAVSGSLQWEFKGLFDPCGSPAIISSTDTPEDGPITETLSGEVTSPIVTAGPAGSWRPTNSATASRLLAAGSGWSGSNAPLGLDETYFDFTVSLGGSDGKAVLIVQAGYGGGPMTKYAVPMTLASSGKPGEFAGTIPLQRVTLDEGVEGTLCGLPVGKFVSGGDGDELLSVTLLDVLQEGAVADCAACATQTGQQSNHLSSINWNLNLGDLANGHPAGFLGLHAEEFSANVFKPAGLHLSLPGGEPDGLGVVYRPAPDRGVRQVHTGGSIFDVVTHAEDASVPTGAFEVRYYPQADSTPAPGNPSLLVPGKPVIERTRFSDPDGGGNRLVIERFGAGSTAFSTVEYAYASSTNTWSLAEQGIRRTDRTTVIEPGGNIETITVSVWDITTPTPTPVSKVREKIQIVTRSDGVVLRELIERTLDPDGAALVSTWEHVEMEGRRRVRVYRSHTGAWEYRSYLSAAINFSSMRAENTITPLLDGAFEDTAPTGRQVHVVMGARVVQDGETIDGIQTARAESNGLWTLTQDLNVPVARDGQNYKVSRTARSLNGEITPDANTVWEISQTYADGPFIGRHAYRLDRAGVLEVTTYSLDSVTNNITQTTSRGAPNEAKTAVVDGTQTVTVTNQNGELVSRKVTDVASIIAGHPLVLENETVQLPDARGRPLQILLSDGSQEQRTYNTCCGLLESVTRHGITTSYTYDALRRKTSETSNGITLVYTYDALDRLVRTKRIGAGPGASEIVLSTTTYDLAGRVTATTDARGEETTYAETYDVEGGNVTRTTTAPDDSTVVEVAHRDGSPRSRSGTAVAPVNWTYEFLFPPFSNEMVTVITENRAQPDTTATDRIKTTTDALGRAIKVEYADGAVQTAQYNAKDQLEKQVDPDGVVTLFGYNALNEREIQALDVNRNGIIDYAGTDRISRTQRAVVEAHGATVLRTTTSVWAADGADSPTEVSVSESSADGKQTWQTAHGLPPAHVQIAYVPASAQRTETITASDGTVTERTYLSDRLQQETTSHSQLTPSPGTLASVAYTYDAHGRVETVTDARTGATHYTYYDDGQVHTVTTPDPDTNSTADGYEPQTTSYVYDDMGRPTLVTRPDGEKVHTTYLPTGAVEKTWRARPVAGHDDTTYDGQKYEYDEQGRMKKLITWQKFSTETGRAETTWNYDTKRGWLTGKTDNEGKGATYTYSPAGRLAKRFWARHAMPTLYGYDDAGSLVSIVYPDATTEVEMAYDRLGRVLRRTDAGGTCTYGYQGLTGLVASETHAGGLFAGFSVNRTFNQLRLSGVSVKDPQAATVSSAAYEYDPASRLRKVTNGANTATYAYVIDSSLVDTVTFAEGVASRLTTTKSYDKLNRLGSISSVPSASSAVSASYTYNSANQRIKAVRQGGAYWNYGYDDQGQVTSGRKFTDTDAAMLGHDFAWDYDEMGNRKMATVNGKESEYFPNVLNQYTSREVPDVVELLGSADPAATVTVNNAAVGRQGALYYSQLTVNNSSAAQYVTLNVRGVKAGVTVDELRHAFVAKTQEDFAYDADGNLVQDGKWTYAWDSENRLTTMETGATAAAAGVPKKRLVFAYDAMGRRIAKRVLGWDATAAAWGIQSSKLFVYDGWNLLMELDALASNAVVRSYTWGLDISGSFQGAGGVGGLLFASSLAPSPSLHAPCYDGNGNVIGLVDMATGATSATYDYNAFGETVIADGPAATLLPFLFSTKYTDNETSLVYYGFRYYSPGTGRWINRDPLGEAAGINLNRFVQNNPAGLVDLLGWLQIPGHTYSAFIAGTIAGRKDATRLAYYAAMPDALEKTTAFSVGWPVYKAFMNGIGFGMETAFPDFSKIQRALHSLDGGNASERRDCLRRLLTDPDQELSPWQKGFLIHAFGDAYFHTKLDRNGNEVLYEAPIGHGMDGIEPDLILTHKDKFERYMRDLAEVLHGGPLSQAAQSELDGFIQNVNGQTAKTPSGEAEYFRMQAIRRGYDPRGYVPVDALSEKDYVAGPGLKYGIPVPSDPDIQKLLNRIKCACMGR